MSASRVLPLVLLALVAVPLAGLEAQQRPGGAPPLAAPGAAPQAAPRAAAPRFAPGAITAIEVQGNQRIEADTIRSYMLLQPGDMPDADRLDRSLKTLFATGLFRDVEVRQDGSRIVVRVVENPIINRVAFEGNRAILDDTLRGEVQLRPRAVFTPAAAQSDRQRILELYARRGRFSATVEPKIIELEQNRVDVVFEIDDGAAALISRINFVGNRAFSDSRLKEIVISREAAWYRPLSTTDSYQPERLNFDRELLRRFYLRQGYADINVTGAVAELAPDRSGFFVTYTLDEGTRYRVGRVEVTSSVRNLDGAALRPQVDASEGDWYDGDAVERSVEAITTEANRLGFPFIEVTPRVTREREERRVDLVFEVADGPRAYVERIDITGNLRTEDRVIRREFRIAEGDPLNPAQVRRSRDRIRNTGYFGDVQIGSSPGSAPDRVVLTTQVQERATGELSLGGGYSTDAGFLADLGLRERNLGGTGIDARFNFTLAQRRSQLDVSVTDPSFLDRNLAAGVDLFAVQRDLQNISGYNERRYGFAVRVGYEFNEYMRQSWSYSLVSRDVYDVSPFASIYIQEQEGTTILGQLGQTLTYDRRDNRLDPKSGYVVRVGADFAGIGGDVYYVRGRGDVIGYIPLERFFNDPDFVLAIAGGIGYLEPYNGQTERIVDRFFLGGENLRGFSVGGAGPRDLATNDSLGGRFIWTQSTEFRFPLPFIAAELGLSGRAFVDVGSLSQLGQSGPTIVDDPAPRVGMGVGLSWRSPFGLINIDLAQAVVKESYDETQVFRLGFGTRF